MPHLPIPSWRSMPGDRSSHTVPKRCPFGNDNRQGRLSNNLVLPSQTRLQYRINSCSLETAIEQPMDIITGKILKLNGWPDGKIIGIAKDAAAQLAAQGLER